jgi:hypothetical protein
MDLPQVALRQRRDRAPQKLAKSCDVEFPGGRNQGIVAPKTT